MWHKINNPFPKFTGVKQWWPCSLPWRPDFLSYWTHLGLLTTHGAMGLLPDTQNYGLHMRRECRERFPCHRLQRKTLVSDPGMHHGTCATHVPWCMSGLLTHGGGENVPGIPGAWATRSFAYLVRGPWFVVSIGSGFVRWHRPITYNNADLLCTGIEGIAFDEMSLKSSNLFSGTCIENVFCIMAAIFFGLNVLNNFTDVLVFLLS